MDCEKIGEDRKETTIAQFLHEATLTARNSAGVHQDIAILDAKPRHFDLARLQVAMNDASLMRVVKRRRRPGSSAPAAGAYSACARPRKR
jgi:hypothetical protein